MLVFSYSLFLLPSFPKMSELRPPVSFFTVFLSYHLHIFLSLSLILYPSRARSYFIYQQLFLSGIYDPLFIASRLFFFFDTFAGSCSTFVSLFSPLPNSPLFLLPFPPLHICIMSSFLLFFFLPLFCFYMHPFLVYSLSLFFLVALPSCLITFPCVHFSYTPFHVCLPFLLPKSSLLLSFPYASLPLFLALVSPPPPPPPPRPFPAPPQSVLTADRSYNFVVGQMAFIGGKNTITPTREPYSLLTSPSLSLLHSLLTSFSPLSTSSLNLNFPSFSLSFLTLPSSFLLFLLPFLTFS